MPSGPPAAPRRKMLPLQRPTRLGNRGTMGKFLVLGVLLLLLFLGWKGWRIYSLATDLRQDMPAVQEVLRAGPDSTALEQLEPLLSRARQNASDLRSEAALFFPLTPLLGWVPIYGADIAAAEPVLTVVAGATAAADETVRVLMPLAADFEGTDPLDLTPAQVQQLTSARPKLEQSRAAITEALAAWEEVPVAELSSTLQGYMQRIGPLLPALDAGIHLSIAASETSEALGPVLFERDNEQPLSVALVELADSREQIVRARAEVESAIVALERVPLAEIPAPLREQVQRIGPLLPHARDGLDLAYLLPDLLGADERREYLLINQNPDELRATGGYIGSAGPLVFEEGSLIENTIIPTDFVPREYPPPPEPLRHYMGLDKWVPRDANWSPDFPTAAQTILDLYAIEQERQLDSLIAVNPRAVQLLLEATGPVQVEPAGELVSAENVIQYMRDNYNLGLSDETVGKKDFIGHLMDAILDKLQTDHADVDMLAMVASVTEALDERHLLLFIDDEEAAAFLAAREWDGAVRPGAHDFLMVVGSNMGYNKANPSIRQDVTYEVDLSDPAAPQAILTVRHAHRLDLEGECNHWGGKAYAWSTYEGSFVDCYWDYLRVLVPEGSELLSWEAPPIPGAWLGYGWETGEDGRVTLSDGDIAGIDVLSNFLVVPFGGEHRTVSRYRLPPQVVTQDAQGGHYQLTIQQQPGRETPVFQVRVHLPEGAELVSTSRVPDMRAGQTLFFGFGHPRDHRLRVSWE